MQERQLVQEIRMTTLQIIGYTEEFCPSTTALNTHILIPLKIGQFCKL